MLRFLNGRLHLVKINRLCQALSLSFVIRKVYFKFCKLFIKFLFLFIQSNIMFQFKTSQPLSCDVINQ